MHPTMGRNRITQTIKKEGRNTIMEKERMTTETEENITTDKITKARSRVTTNTPAHAESARGKYVRLKAS